MMEEQLQNQLMDQSQQVAPFIQSVWPELLNKAQDVLSTFPDAIDEIILCGCGDSHHAAIGVEMAFDIWGQKAVRAAPAMFASRYLIPRMKNRADRALVIGISASGEVARTIEAVQLAKDAGATTLAYTSNPESTLGVLADGCISVESPEFSGPGLISYIASLLMGYATCAHFSEDEQRDELLSKINEVPNLVVSFLDVEQEMGMDFARDMQREEGCVFVAGGSLFGSALFSAAKVIESAGIHSWAQELEEWAHLEYFCQPAQMPTWFLSCSGRTQSREKELFNAAQVLGRRFCVSRWEGSNGWSAQAREALAPLILWAGPVAFAASISEKIGEVPFRGFSGGRSAVEGGGASRIRSSKRLSKLRDLMN